VLLDTCLAFFLHVLSSFGPCLQRCKVFPCHMRLFLLFLLGSIYKSCSASLRGISRSPIFYASLLLLPLMSRFLPSLLLVPVFFVSSVALLVSRPVRRRSLFPTNLFYLAVTIFFFPLFPELFKFYLPQISQELIYLG